MTTTPAPRTGKAPAEPWSPAEFEDRLRAVARERYHDRHPFNVRMHEGDLSPAEVRAWIANRFHYQRHIPVKDALITAKLDSPRLRRMWLRRIEDHDGRAEGEGGIERWLRLGEAAGLDRRGLLAGDRVLPGVRLAVDGYVNFCRLRPPLEAVAASLTELTAPHLMRLRIDAFERHYAWIAPEGLAYFRGRVSQGRRDSTEALALVLEWARTREDQGRAVAALTFKCDILWSLLDAVQHHTAPVPSPDRPEDPDRRPRPEPDGRVARRGGRGEG
ncbi:pyrroloquinoline-quinone synthase PqqC [Streptomyces sp. NPDC000345]|uniref:pyrroloquinoline-quinone synthase PqqC n=1 Tax=Streptomyces sp. NPDC000345 TaxID=3364537 RepID=UPI00368D1E57